MVVHHEQDEVAVLSPSQGIRLAAARSLTTLLGAVVDFDLESVYARVPEQLQRNLAAHVVMARGACRVGSSFPSSARGRAATLSRSASHANTSVVDAHGVEVPDAGNSILTSVSGTGTFQGADNGRQDDAEGYKSNRHDAFNGKLLAIVRSTTSPGPITVRTVSDGLLPAPQRCTRGRREVAG
jgi:hypothetical protein